MKIKFTDVNGEILSNIEVFFTVSDNPEVYVTDSKGIIEFFEASEGEKVTCYLEEEEKHEFIYKEGKTPEIKVTAPLIDMLFITINEEEESVIGATVCFEYLDKKVEMISDNTGQIVLKKVPVNTDVKVYQLHDDKEINVEINKCKKDKAQYFIIVDKFFDYTSMKFKLVDKSGQIIRGADVRFRVDSDEFELLTNQDGCIILNEIKIGSSVECKQMIFGKSLPWHKFKCESNIDEYILHGEKPQSFNQSSEKYDSQVRMRFKLINSKQLPIPNAVLRLEYGDKVRNRYTNQFGEAMVDDVLIGDKINAFVDLRGVQVSAEFICQEDDEMHQIILKSGSSRILIWLIPIIIVIGVIIYFASSNTSGNTVDKSDDEGVAEKDTLIINNYFFQVNEAKSGSPVAGTKVSLYYKDTVFQMITNKDGMAKFPSRANIIPEKYDVFKLGYSSFSKEYSADSVFVLQISKNDSVGVYEEVMTCNTEIQAGIYKTTYNNFKVNLSKGTFKIWINLFDIPDKVEIFNGPVQSTPNKKPIFSTNGFVKGIIYPAIAFESPDSIISVAVTSSGNKATWYYKIYCARQAAPVITGNNR